MLLITGISGLLGRSLASLCSEKQIPYIGTYSSRKYTNSYSIDFLNKDDLVKFLKEHAITVCINCMVERQVDVCETNWNKTKQVNVDMVDCLASVCRELDIYLIHISTDYVFDGKTGANYPSSQVNPLQNYGISKLLSEKRVQSHLTRYSILRVPVLYTDSVENLSENAVTVIGKKVLNQVESSKEDDYSIRRPVYIPDFCEFIMSFITQHRYGIYHFYNPSNLTTKYKTAKQIGMILGMPTDHIEPIATFSNLANRPFDTELRDNQYNIHEYHHTSLYDGLVKCFQKWAVPKVTETTSGGIVFLLMDLDGTILDTDRLHFQAYERAFHDFHRTLSWTEFEQAIHGDGMDVYLRSLALPFDSIKQKKKEYMLQLTDVSFIEGAKEFLEHILQYNLNLVIVTNTSNDVVNHYKQRQPILQQIKNWIVREDYSRPKPDPECYQVAIQRYYQQESYILGFENTMSGYQAIKNQVNMVYFITNKQSMIYDTIKKEDIYLLPNFHSL
jgi:dTDP-4-dehydrorhamnose reductase